MFNAATKRLSVGLILAAILVACCGPSCDSDAEAVFRQEATGTIGEGVRTIMNGVLDGLIASIEQAGDGAAATADTNQ